MSQKKPKFKGTANPAMHAAMFAKRVSNAAGTHDNRPNRQRTRSAAARAAIRSNGW